MKQLAHSMGRYAGWLCAVLALVGILNPLGAETLEVLPALPHTARLQFAEDRVDSLPEQAPVSTDPQPFLPAPNTQPAPASTPTPAPSPAPAPVWDELTVETLVQEVLERNPSLAAMVAVQQAAAARYPQVTSLDDPMFAATLGPASYTSNTVNGAYRLEISQKYPYPGKRALRGQTALAEAGAASNDVDDMRLQLIESAHHAFYEYYLVARALTVNHEGLRLLQEARQNAENRFTTGQALQQDVLQVDLEIGRQRQRLFTLERMRRVAIARINMLMHRPPENPLAPPPTDVVVGSALPDMQALRASAQARRPDLQALVNRLRAEEAGLALACRESYPDFEPFAMYDRFMGNSSQSEDLATMVGVRLNLPVRTARRQAAVTEAQARIAQRRAELDRQTDQVDFQVQEAYEQVVESWRTVQLYQESILRDVKVNVKAAQAAYEAGKVPLAGLLEAERSQLDLLDRYYEAAADYGRRRATLERVVGGPLTSFPTAPGHPPLNCRSAPDPASIRPAAPAPGRQAVWLSSSSAAP